MLGSVFRLPGLNTMIEWNLRFCLKKLSPELYEIKEGWLASIATANGPTVATASFSLLSSPCGSFTTFVALAPTVLKIK